MKTNNLTDDIFSIIRQHVGAENAITAAQICVELGLPRTTERRVRQIISDELFEWLICARAGVGDNGGTGGYFIPSNYCEIQAYWAYLADLAASAQGKFERFDANCRDNGFAMFGEQGKAAA